MVFQFGLNQHLFSKLNPLFVFSIAVVQLINQSFDLCDRPAFKMNIYHKFKVSYIIRHVKMQASWSRGHATDNQDWDLIPESQNRSDRSVTQ